MKKLLLIILAFLFWVVSVYSQYDYGLDVINMDAKIEGKLNLNDGNSNVLIGTDAGINIDTSGNSLYGRWNTLIGSRCGKNLTTGNSNTLMGFRAGENLNSGVSNTLIGAVSGPRLVGSNNTTLGQWAGSAIQSGNRNVFIGQSAAGQIVNGHDNVIIGQEAGYSGFNSQASYSSNVLIGKESGTNMKTGVENTFLGTWSGLSQETGLNNVFLGVSAGSSNVGGSANTFVGARTGHNNNSGTGNVFIGNSAGYNENGSNILYIENSTSSTPLIYGEFDNDIVQINGSLHIAEYTRLIPSATPTSPEKGTMYYDSTDDKVKVWTGSSWENLFFSSTTQTENSFNQNNHSPCNTSCVEENQKLKVRMEQLETKLKKHDALEAKLERMEKLLNQLSESSSINQNIEINKTARLEQNIPNPFRSMTTIKYFLPEYSKNSRLNIYDISGQVLKTIQLEGNGMGEVDIRVDEFSKGVYHYSLEINGRIVDTKKMSSIK